MTPSIFWNWILTVNVYRDPDISEVFSRGQNPQHWHITRRGLSLCDIGSANDGEVYMGIYKKEASLGDVDNALASVVRQCSDMSATM